VLILDFLRMSELDDSLESSIEFVRSLLEAIKVYIEAERRVLNARRALQKINAKTGDLDLPEDEKALLEQCVLVQVREKNFFSFFLFFPPLSFSL
jgi:hypothetical protein